MSTSRNDIFQLVILGVGLVAAITDLLRAKIYNWLTIPTLAIGLAWSCFDGGLAGLGASALGAAVGLAAYGWMFGIGVMGGGDVKLLMALGAWGGPRFTGEVALLGVLLGGVMAIPMLAFKGRLTPFVRKLQLLFVAEIPHIDRKMTMPYGVPIAAAAAWVALDNPFVRFHVWG